jgi:hypothetical protein
MAFWSRPIPSVRATRIITGPAVGSDDDLQNHHSLVLCLARFFGVFGLGIVDRVRRAHSSTDAVGAGTEPASTACADTGPLSHAVAST